MFFIFFIFLLPTSIARWTKPNIYSWLEQNSYICYLELHSVHDLRFLHKDEAEQWQCSCGDPLLTQSACARDSRLKRPFCAKLPELCMKAYNVIFKAPIKQVDKSESLNRQIAPVAKENQFFTLSPKFIENSPDFKALQQNDIVAKVEHKRISPPSIKPTTPPPTIPQKTVPRASSLPPSTTIPSLLDGEVSAQNKELQGIEIFLNNTDAMNRLMDILIKRLIESNKSSNTTLLDKLGVQHGQILHQKAKKINMVKMLSSKEESAPIQRVIFSESIKPEEANETIHPQSPTEKEPLILRPHSSKNITSKTPSIHHLSTTIPKTTSAMPQKPINTTASPSLILSASPVTSLPIRISRTRPPRKNRTQFHDKLVRIQKQLLQILGEKFDDFDDEDDVINDNDIITVFREHEDDEKRGKDLAFSDDSGEETIWSEEGSKEQRNDPFKKTPFNPKICEDNHPLCEFWSLYRRCRLHAGFMYKFCRKSCGICE